MKISHVEGLANHNGPESCGAAREGGVEALTGERTGRVLSREIHALLRKAAPHHSLAASAFCLSSLSFAAHGRYYLTQEPDAGNPLVRIRGGGHEQS